MTKSWSESPSKASTSMNGSLLSANTIRKQRIAIDALEADTRRLKDELMEENRFIADPTTQSAKKLIQSLESQDKIYEKLIYEQQELMESLLDRENELTEEIDAQRTAMGGVNSATEVSIRAQRRVVLFENRVKQAATARSTVELEANKLKERVDGLRKEKRLFEGLTAKIEASIHKKAQEMAEILDKTAEAHDAKCKAEAMRAQVLAHIDKDNAASEAEWTQITVMLDADRKRREAIQASKAAERSRRMEELMQRQRSIARGRGNGKKVHQVYQSRKNQKINHQGQEENRSVDHTGPPPSSSSCVNGNGNNNNHHNESLKTPSERLDTVNNLLCQVVDGMPGCTSPQDTLHALRQLKELCFKLFGSLTDAHTRLEGLEDGTENGTTSKVNLTDNSSSPSPGNTVLEQSRSARGKLRKEYEDAQQQMHTICTHVHATCQLLRPYCPEIDEALLKEGCPTLGSLIYYVGLIERWTNFVLQDYLPSCSDILHTTAFPLLSLNQEKDYTAALVDPPSVGSRRSSRAGSTSSSGASAYTSTSLWKKIRYGRQKQKKNSKKSYLSSESSGIGNKVLDIEKLGEHARREVALRLAEATVTNIGNAIHEPCKK